MNSGTEVGGQLAPTASEIQRQVERIAASHGLRNAGPILNVFLYLAKQSLDGAGHAVKEHEIATAALGRPQDFDPRLDSTVRVVVMRLRSRVAEYYIHEGIQDPILIDIPKGSYCLSVTRRVAEELPTSAPEIVAEQADKKARGARRIALAAILAAALVAAYFAGKYEIFTHQPVELRSFWSGLLESGEPLLVFSNPIFQGTPEGGMRLLDPSAFHADGTNDSFTGAGEVMAVHE